MPSLTAGWVQKSIFKQPEREKGLQGVKTTPNNKWETIRTDSYSCRKLKIFYISDICNW